MALPSISGTTKFTGLIGHPVAHSRSPRIHHHWLAKHQIAARYLAFDVAPSGLPHAIKGAQALGVLGLNITIPYKENVLEYVDEIDPLARAVGAANTLHITAQKICAYNTDVYGIAENLRSGAGDLSPYLSCALVLGAGGAARAAIMALHQLGVREIMLANRTLRNAEQLAASMPVPVQIIQWENKEKALEHVRLLVNATSLGMLHHAPLTLDLSCLSTDALVHDSVYAPLQTELLTQAQARGNKTVSGIGMLLYQAQAAFEIWHGIKPEIDAEILQLAVRGG